jgi:hypothetical protein
MWTPVQGIEGATETLEQLWISYNQNNFGIYKMWNPVQGIEGAAETLEQLWISYNQIDKLKPIRNLTKLHTLYMAHNMVNQISTDKFKISYVLFEFLMASMVC